MRVNDNIAGILPQITGVLTLQNGTEIVLVNRDFVANSLCIKEGTSNSNEFTVGAAVIGGLDFELMSDSGKFDGINWYDSKVDLYLSFGTVGFSMAEYWIVHHHEIGNIIQVECYDALKILDEYALYELNLTFPCTVSTIVNAIASSHNLLVYGLQHGDITVPDPNDDKMTQRACISYLAQITGQYVKARSNALYFDWYDTTTQYDAGTTFSHDLRTNDLTITGVVVYTKDEAASQSRGTTDYQIEISDNPFISSDNVSAIADNIYAAVNGITFRPGSLSIKANAAIEAGDCLKVNTAKESNVVVLATTIQYKPQLQEPIVSDADADAGDLRINRSAYIKKQAEQATDSTIHDMLQDSDSELSQAIAAAGGGSTSMQTVQSIHTTLKEWTLTTSLTTPQYYIAEVSQDGSFTMHEIKSWGLDDQMIIVPSYDYCNHIATRAKKNLNAYVFNISARGHVEFRRDGSTSSEYVYFRFNIPRCYWTNSSRITLGNPSGNYGRDTMVIAAPQWYRGWFEPTESTEEYAKGDPTYYIAPAVFGATQLRKNTTSTGGLDWDWFVPA